jgi:Leucine-rich repeat (LRR) protein
LKALKNLRELRLNDTDVCDDTLVNLKQFTNLERLSLNGTQVSDAGVKHLVALSNLKELIADDTDITDKGASLLREALPGCKHIQYGHGPSYGKRRKVNQ